MDERIQDTEAKQESKQQEQQDFNQISHSQASNQGLSRITYHS